MAKLKKQVTSPENEDAEVIETDEVEETDAVDESVDDDSSTSTDEETDYDAIIEGELESETERRIKAERKLAEDRYNNRKGKHRGDEDTTDDDDDADSKPVTRRELQDIHAKAKADALLELQEDRAKELIAAHTSSEKEAKAAFIVWKKRVTPTGNLKEDIMFAIGGLNHKRTLAQNIELGRALGGKTTATRIVTQSQRQTETIGPKVSAEMAASLKRAGFTFDPKLKIYKKKLPSGKFLMKDLKSGQTRLLQ